MIPWWTLLPVLYVGMSLGVLATHGAEVDRSPLTAMDVFVLLAFGPFVVTWLCGARAIRSRAK